MVHSASSPPHVTQIKKRQADQLKTIRDNPMKMQQIIQEVRGNMCSLPLLLQEADG